MKTKKDAIGKQALILTLSKFVALVIATISAMLLSRFRTLTEYGTYSQLLIVINISTTIVSMGLPNSINYFLSQCETEEEREQFLSTYYTINTLISAALGILLVFTSPIVISYFNNPLLNDFIYFLALMPWVKIISSSIENVLIVLKKSKIILAYRMLNSVSLLLIIIIIKLLNLSFQAYMIAYVFAECLFAVLVYFIVNYYVKVTPMIDFTLIKKILKFSIPLGFASIIGTLNIELDKLVIGGFLSADQLAIYTNASKEMPVTIISTSISAVLLPQFVKLLKKGETKRAIGLWGDSVIVSYSIICFISFALIVFAPEVITVLYSIKYIDGVEVFIVYSLTLLLRSTYWGMLLNASGNTKFIMYSSIASLLLNLILNYVFFAVFGFVGPAIATLLSQLIINLAQLLFTSRKFKISFLKIMPWAKMLMITFLNFLVAVLILVLKFSFPLDMYFGKVGEALFLGLVWIPIIIVLLYKPIVYSWTKLNSRVG